MASPASTARMSTAVGVALAAGVDDGPTVALMGDLTFLHDVDRPGDRAARAAARPDDRGQQQRRRCHLLHPGAGRAAARRAFDRVFGTPHGVLLAGLAESCGAEHVFVSTADELADAIGDPGGIRVVEVPTSRTELAGTLRRLTEAVRAAL